MASTSDATAAQAFLQAVNCRDTATATQLLTAAQAAGPEQLSTLLTATDERQRTGVHVAASAGDVEMVQQLLAAGAPLVYPCGSEPTASESVLHKAAGAGDETAVRVLLAIGGVDVDALAETVSHSYSPSARRTALHEAATHGHAGVVQMLLEAGANPSPMLGRHVPTPLIEAALRNHASTVQLLLSTPEGRAYMNWEALGYETALSEAVENGCAAALKALLDAGADPRTGRPGLESPLATAAAECAYLDGARREQVLDLMLTHPSTAVTWTAAELTTAAVAAASEIIVMFDMSVYTTYEQRKLAHRLLCAAAKQQDAAAGMHSVLRIVECLQPRVLSLFASICMDEWLAADAAGPDVPAEQRTVQQLVVGAVGLLTEQQPDEGAEQEQQGVSQLETALQRL